MHSTKNVLSFKRPLSLHHQEGSNLHSQLPRRCQISCSKRLESQILRRNCKLYKLFILKNLFMQKCSVYLCRSVLCIYVEVYCIYVEMYCILM